MNWSVRGSLLMDIPWHMLPEKCYLKCVTRVNFVWKNFSVHFFFRKLKYLFFVHGVRVLFSAMQLPLPCHTLPDFYYDFIVHLTPSELLLHVVSDGF